MAWSMVVALTVVPLTLGPRLAAAAPSRPSTTTNLTSGAYRLVGSDGGVFAFGGASFDGSMGGKPLNRPAVGMASTPDGRGYWLVAADGGIFAFGDAGFYGSMGGTRLAAPIVGMVASNDGRGYWLVAADGGSSPSATPGSTVRWGHTSQCARRGHGGEPHRQRLLVGRSRWWGLLFRLLVHRYEFDGSMGGKPLNRPIVGMTSTADGQGYWLVAADGGIFAFGDAAFDGSMGGKPLSRPIVGMTSTADGQGYWLVAADGGIFAFGDAAYEGSMGGTHLAAPITGLALSGATTGSVIAPGLPSFYAVPTQLPTGPPGTLLKWEQVPAPGIDGTVYLVMYLSETELGRPVAVTGLVMVPESAPPPDGYPVVTWGHGTNGMAPQCAPSLQPASAVPLQNQLLDQGWEVTASDYQGEGTPGLMPYLAGVGAARNTIDIVPRRP